MSTPLLHSALGARSDRRVALASGLGCVALGVLAGRRPTRPERVVHAAANHHTRGRTWLRAPQQLGTPWALALLSVAGFATHRPHLAVSAACAVPLEKALEVAVQDLVDRTRPADADPRTVLHDDAPTGGGSYPSGHAARALCTALLAAPYLPGPLAGAAVAAGCATGWIRLRQGAHFPLDVLGGALLGASVAAAARGAFGVPSR